MYLELRKHKLFMNSTPFILNVDDFLILFLSDRAIQFVVDLDTLCYWLCGKRDVFLIRYKCEYLLHNSL